MGNLGKVSDFMTKRSSAKENTADLKFLLLNLYDDYDRAIGLLTFALDEMSRQAAVENLLGLTPGPDKNIVCLIRDFLDKPDNSVQRDKWRKKAKDAIKQKKKEDDEQFNF